MRVGSGGNKGAGGGKGGGLQAKEHGDQNGVRLGVDATQEEVCVPPADPMRRNGEVNLEARGMGFKPLQLLIERPKAADESLMAVTWDFGEEDRLEGRQVFGGEIIAVDVD